MNSSMFKNITVSDANSNVQIIKNLGGTEAVLRAVTINSVSATGITLYDTRLVPDPEEEGEFILPANAEKIATIGDEVTERTLNYHVSVRFGIIAVVSAGFDGDFTVTFN